MREKLYCRTSESETQPEIKYHLLEKKINQVAKGERYMYNYACSNLPEPASIQLYM